MAELRAVPTRPSRLPSAEEAEGWIGWRVDDINGSMVGEVERLCRDESGSPRWLVVREDDLEEGRRFVIPAADAVGCIRGRVWCPHPRERIRMSARIAPGEPSGSTEALLSAHYAPQRRAA